MPELLDSPSFTLQEVLAALEPMGMDRRSIEGYIFRELVYGIPKKGPGHGKRRSYSMKGVISLLLLDRLSRYFPMESLARQVIPAFWQATRRLHFKGEMENLAHIWAAECEDSEGKVFHIVMSNARLSKEIDLGDGWKGRVLSQTDLAPDIWRVTRALLRLAAERLDKAVPEINAKMLQQSLVAAAHLSGGSARV